MTPDAMKLWQGFVRVALGDDSAADGEFLNWLVRVRNNAAYHYYQPKALITGYRKHFDSRPVTPQNEFAYASLGRTMEESRFYFGDAAVAEAYGDEGSLSVANRLRQEGNKVLRSVVEAYLTCRTLTRRRVAERKLRAQRRRHQAGKPFRTFKGRSR